jgi:hypothetical protein
MASLVSTVFSCLLFLSYQYKRRLLLHSQLTAGPFVNDLDGCPAQSRFTEVGREVLIAAMRILKEKNKYMQNKTGIIGKQPTSMPLVSSSLLPTANKQRSKATVPQMPVPGIILWQKLPAYDSTASNMVMGSC